ncbi:ORF6N domain-containing protein [Candidatus Saccharibacteria bacterium]|nr:ORF6N domain-containing protein [Candidatus Saccharibacteria bacterium]
MVEKAKGKNVGGDGGGEIIKITEGNLYNKIYTIRGQKVMLDFDLAEIYGYTTSAFNQQVKRNIEKFEGEDFMFQLTMNEVSYCSRCQNDTLNVGNSSSSRSQFVTLNVQRGQNIKYLPYAFTEQGIYMLMTVLRGELAVKQSRTLIRLFKSMKDYYLEGGSLISKIVDNSNDIAKIKTEIKEINSEMENVVKKSEISPMFLDFSKVPEKQEFLIINGEIVKAKDAIIDIYRYAKEKIYIIDNYVSYKTLRLLLEVKENIDITIFTDKNSNHLKNSDLQDFKKERPDLKIKFICTNKTIHDRFIILDEKIFYLVGSSSKDIGKKMTTILEITDTNIHQILIKSIKKLEEKF